MSVLAPRFIKVGPFRNRVRFVDKPENDDGNILLGQLQHTAEVMIVSTDQSTRNQQETVVHESLHGIFEVLGLSYEMRDQPEMEEELIRRLAPAILAWLRDNRGMVAWLTS